MKSCVLKSKTERFWAEVQEVSLGRAEARYFGPNRKDRGVKEHEGNWPGIQESVHRQLKELESAHPELGTNLDNMG